MRARNEPEEGAPAGVSTGHVFDMKPAENPLRAMRWFSSGVANQPMAGGLGTWYPEGATQVSRDFFQAPEEM